MRLPLLIFLFVWAISGKSQGWVTPGTFWTYSYIPGFCFCDGYVNISYLGEDTIIDNKQCQILNKSLSYYDSFDSASYLINDYGREYIYYENNIVYNYRYGQFFVLYNFNAVEGSSWTVAGYEDGQSCDSIAYYLVVDSIGTDTLNGLELKWMDVSQFNYPNYLGWGFSGRIYEKIGCIGYMLPEPFCIADGNYGGPLRCFSDSSWSYETGIVSECTFINTGIPETEKPKVKIFPNPASNQITIEQLSVSGNQLSVEIYDALGRLVNLSVVEGQTSTIHLNLSKGVYLLRVKEKEEVVFWEKLIIE